MNGVPSVDILYRIPYSLNSISSPISIAECPDGEGTYYDNAEDMVDNHKVNQKLLKDIWQEFEILGM